MKRQARWAWSNELSCQHTWQYYEQTLVCGCLGSGPHHLLLKMLQLHCLPTPTHTHWCAGSITPSTTLLNHRSNQIILTTWAYKWPAPANSSSFPPHPKLSMLSPPTAILPTNHVFSFTRLSSGNLWKAIPSFSSLNTSLPFKTHLKYDCSLNFS